VDRWEIDSVRVRMPEQRQQNNDRPRGLTNDRSRRLTSEKFDNKVSVYFSLREPAPIGRMATVSAKKQTTAKLTGYQKSTKHPTGEVEGAMIQPRTDKISNFVLVQHTFTKEKFYVHQDDNKHVGTDEKIIVYTSKFAQYFGPGTEYPTGHYTAKTRVFIASFLEAAGQ